MSRPTDDWWADLERDFLACLDGDGTASVVTIARRLKMSEDAAGSLSAMLAREGKVKSGSSSAAAAATRPHR